jgi:hypothetical protein
VNATLLALVRNEELEDMISSMKDLERTFNKKFNYPWLFLNDKEFTEEFKRRISMETKAKVTFGKRLQIIIEIHVDRNRYPSKRALGYSRVDKRGSLPGICPSSDGEESPICRQEVISPDV